MEKGNQGYPTHNSVKNGFDAIGVWSNLRFYSGRRNGKMSEYGKKIYCMGSAVFTNIVMVRLYDTPGKINELRTVADKHGGVIIEDAAEFLGAK